MCPRQVDLTVRVEAFKPDGRCYRHWDGSVEYSSDTGCSIVTEPGTKIFSGDKLGWVQPHFIRTIFSFQHPLNILEVRNPDNSPFEIYVNIATPAIFFESRLTYTDFELDVVRDLTSEKPAELIDMEELEEAVLLKQVSEAEATETLEIGNVVLELVNTWNIDLDSKEQLDCLDKHMKQANRTWEHITCC